MTTFAPKTDLPGEFTIEFLPGDRSWRWLARWNYENSYFSYTCKTAERAKEIVEAHADQVTSFRKAHR